MFIGQVLHWAEQRRYLPTSLVLAFEEARAQDLTVLEPGRYPLTSVPEAFFLVQQLPTKRVEETRPEAHEKFIDIQFLLEGQEKFGIAQPEKSLEPVENLFIENDIAFYPTPAHESFVVLHPGQFIIFYPGELHRPLCQVQGEESVRKVVVKVPVKALQESLRDAS